MYPGEMTLGQPDFTPSPDLVATDKTPPAFIVQAEDDGVHVENAITYFMILKKAKVPAEMHIYAEGGHGYGLRRTDKPVTTWPQTAVVWLHTIKILPSTAR
jgi:acetyl esterase/lipase